MCSARIGQSPLTALVQYNPAAYGLAKAEFEIQKATAVGWLKTILTASGGGALALLSLGALVGLVLTLAFPPILFVAPAFSLILLGLALKVFSLTAEARKKQQERIQTAEARLQLLTWAGLEGIGLGAKEEAFTRLAKYWPSVVPKVSSSDPLSHTAWGGEYGQAERIISTYERDHDLESHPLPNKNFHTIVLATVLAHCNRNNIPEKQGKALCHLTRRGRMRKMLTMSFSRIGHTTPVQRNANIGGIERAKAEVRKATVLVYLKSTLTAVAGVALLLLSLGTFAVAILLLISIIPTGGLHGIAFCGAVSLSFFLICAGGATLVGAHILAATDVRLQNAKSSLQLHEQAGLEGRKLGVKEATFARLAQHYPAADAGGNIFSSLWKNGPPKDAYGQAREVIQDYEKCSRGGDALPNKNLCTVVLGTVLAHCSKNGVPAERGEELCQKVLLPRLVALGESATDEADKLLNTLCDLLDSPMNGAMKGERDNPVTAWETVFSNKGFKAEGAAP